MKICFLTDTHLSTTMANRSDDYAGSVLAKWKWIDTWAAADGADIIIHGGDIFDKSVVARWLEHEVLRIIDESSVRYGICVGTHDMGQGEPTVWGKSIGSLQSQRNVYAFSGPDSIRIGDLLLCGSCCNVDWNCGAKVIAVHQMLTDIVVPWDHQPINQIKTNADCVLSGDYHPGWGAWDNEHGTVFINPGALARTFRSTHDLTRIPSFAMIDTDNGTVDVLPVPHDRNVYIEKEIKPLEEVRTSIADAIEDAKKKLGTDDMLDVDGLQIDAPAGLDNGLARLKELCKEVDDKKDE